MEQATEVQNLSSLQLLKKFVENPDDTTEEILNSSLPIAEQFKEIKVALTGEFTRSKAIDIGKHNIVKYYESLLKSILDNDNQTVAEYAASKVKELQEQLDITYRNIDTTVINRRREKYMENSLTVEFINRKINLVVEDRKTKLGSPKSVVEFLYACRELLAKIRLGDFEEIDNVYDKFKKDEYKIKRNVENLGDVDYSIGNLTSNVNPCSLESNEILAKAIDDLDIEQPIEDSETLNIFSSMIDVIDRTATDIKSNIDKLNEKVSKFATTKDLSVQIVTVLNDSVILPYSKMEITAEEYMNKTKELIQCLENVVIIEKDVKTCVDNHAKGILNDINIFYYIYNLIDEATLKGQLDPVTKVGKKDKE